MTRDEVKKCVKYLGELFPGQLTQSLAKMAGDKFEEMEMDDVLAACNRHRESVKGLIAWPELFETCRSAGELRAAKKATAPARGADSAEGSWADVCRRQFPELKGASDPEVTLRIHWRRWDKCGRAEVYRPEIAASCVAKLIHFGVPADKATRYAAAVFADSPEPLRQCLDEIRDAAARANSDASSTLATVYP